MTIDGGLDDIRTTLQSHGESLRGMETRFDRVESRLDRVETRLGRVETDVIGLRREQTDAFGHVLVLLEEVRDATRGLPGHRVKLKKILSFVGQKALTPADYDEIRGDIAEL
jgi:hypothetical protein